MFHISLLREYHSINPIVDTNEEVAAADEFVYGDDFYHISKIMDHKISPHPNSYAEGPVLLFLVRWENFGPSNDSWEPYKNLRQTDELNSYLKRNEKFNILIKSHQ